MHERAEQPDRSQVETGHLAETANTRALWLFAGALLAGLGLCLAIAAAVIWIYTGAPVGREGRTLPEELPGEGTAHWVSPTADLAALRARHEAQLEDYGWVDRDEGIARIPIEEAMRVLAEQAEVSATQPAMEPTRQRPVPEGGSRVE